MTDFRKVVDFHYDNSETKEKVVLLSKAIENEVGTASYNYACNARLNYSFYNTEDEKHQYSIERLLKYRKKLGKCKGDLAGRISNLLKLEEAYYQSEDNLRSEIHVFLYNNYPNEAFEELPLSHFEDYNFFLKHSKYNNSYLEKFVKYLKLMMEYLSCKSLAEYTRNIPQHNINKGNPHPRIFENAHAFRLFERLKTKINNPLADYSFIYRKMINDNLIFESVGDSEFRSWLSSNYEVEIDKMKQLHNCTTNTKEQVYTMTKNSISLK